MDEMTSPETEVMESEVVDTEATDAVESEEVETDGVESESAESEQEDPDSEDVEFEGKKYKLPKTLKEALLRQADYTKKTQEVAETRRALESQAQEFQQRVQIQQQTLQDHAHLMTIDQQLQQLEQLDWNRVIDEDPVQAMKLQQQYNSLRGMREQVTTRINHFAQQQFAQQQQSTAKLIESGSQQLAKEIAGWSPELAKSLKSYGVEKGGFSAEEMSSVLDPRQVKVLHKAYLYDQLMSKQQAKPKAEPAKPVTTIKAQKAQAAKDPDKMSTAEWVKWREAQIRKKR